MAPLIKPKLKSWGTVPYGGTFNLNLPEKGMVGSGYTFEALLVNLTAYRKANAIPVGLGFPEEVEAELCRFYPKECVESDARQPNTRVRTVAEILQGTMIMMRHKLAGSPLVSDEEADRRSAICTQCPNNVMVRMPCTGICQSIVDLVTSIVGAKVTKYDGQLRSCAVCSCYLAASVYVPLEIQCAEVTEEQKAQFALAREQSGCWKQC